MSPWYGGKLPVSLDSVLVKTSVVVISVSVSSLRGGVVNKLEQFSSHCRYLSSLKCFVFTHTAAVPQGLGLFESNLVVVIAKLGLNPNWICTSV